MRLRFFVNFSKIFAFGLILLFFLIIDSLSPSHIAWGINFGSQKSSVPNEIIDWQGKIISSSSISLPFLKQGPITGFGAGEETWDLSTIGDDTILPTSSPLTSLPSSSQDKEIINYLVQPGDTVSSIAASFEITADSIFWANNLNAWSLIKPGDNILIPPVSGVIHKIQNGDTLAEIALKYKAKVDDIIAFNDLPIDGILKIGQMIIVPDGEKPNQVARPVATKARITITGFINSGQSHSYPYGQCTWWVAQKRPVANWGNANTWISRAEADGYSVCRGKNCEPRIGAIISLKVTSFLARRFGHVAYVENVENGQITFSEMNYLGWAKISTRTVPIGDWSILGYIY